MTTHIRAETIFILPKKVLCTMPSKPILRASLTEYAKNVGNLNKGLFRPALEDVFGKVLALPPCAQRYLLHPFAAATERAV